MRKLFGLAAMLACCLLVFSAQSALAAGEVKLRLSCPVATKGSFMGDSIELWKKLIEEKSNGRIKISLHYSGELGSEGETFDQHYKGTVPLLLTYATTRYSEKLGLLSTPYLFNDWNDVREAFKPDGWMTNVYGKIYEEVGIKFLAPYPGGFGGVDTKGKYATNIASAKAQGIKVRCAAIFPLPETMKALGYQVIPVDWNETYTAIQTGLVDGSSNNPIFWTYDTFRDLLQYFVDTHHVFSSADMTMNLDAWNKLSPEDQKVIMDASLEVAAKQFEDAEKTDLHYRQLSIDYGIKYIQPSPEELAEMKKVCRAEIWPLMEKVVGKDLMQLVYDNAK